MQMMLLFLAAVLEDLKIRKLNPNSLVNTQPVKDPDHQGPNKTTSMHNGAATCYI